MIPAKIIEISDKVMVKYGDTIAEVESVQKSEMLDREFIEIDGKGWWLHLGMPVFIEPTTEGKCKIVKLNT